MTILQLKQKTEEEADLGRSRVCKGAFPGSVWRGQHQIMAGGKVWGNGIQLNSVEFGYNLSHGKRKDIFRAKVVFLKHVGTTRV